MSGGWATAPLGEALHQDTRYLAMPEPREHEKLSCFVFLASSDSAYMTGQVLRPNGGEIVNG